MSTRGLPAYIDVVFDGPPGHDGGRFVEVEDPTGASINIGEWTESNGLWALRIPVREDILHILKEVAKNPVSGTDSSCAFCQQYGDEPHTSVKVDGVEQECPVLTARRLLGLPPLPA